MKPNWPLLAGLRFFLATIVVFCHTTFLIDPWGLMPKVGFHFGGFASVFGFLLISGFSIAHSLEKNTKGFYARRFERLAPTYYLCLMFGVAVYALYFCFTSPDNTEWPGMTEEPVSWFAALFMLGGVIALPLPLLQPAWSLGAEICYYAIAPFLARRPLKPLLIAGALSLGHYVWSGIYQAERFTNTPGLATIFPLFWPWLTGWLFYHYRGHQLCWPALVLVVAFFGEANARYAYGSGVTVAVVGLALIVGHQITFSAKINRVLIYLGDLSFPLYLCHYPAIYFAKFLIAKGWLLSNKPIIMLVTYGCAAIITTLVGLRQFRKRKVLQHEACENTLQSPVERAIAVRA